MSVSQQHESADYSRSQFGGSSFSDSRVSHSKSGSWASGYDSEHRRTRNKSQGSEGRGSDETGGTRTAEQARHLCAFWLCGDLYALDVQCIGEVFIPGEVEPVPLSPSGVLGICNLRGTALAVAELAIVMDFGAPTRLEGEMPTLLVMRIGSLSVGGCIDRVEGVHAYMTSDVVPSSDGANSGVLTGLIELGTEENSRTASLLDPNVIGARLEALRFGSGAHNS